MKTFLFFLYCLVIEYFLITQWTTPVSSLILEIVDPHYKYLQIESCFPLLVLLYASCNLYYHQKEKEQANEKIIESFLNDEDED
jgi:hypothetical protein